MCRIDVAGDISLSYLEQLNNVSDSINKIFMDADYVIANLESPVVSDESGRIAKLGPNIKCNKHVLNLLKEIKVDAYTLANNHIGDYGLAGMTETVKYLDSIHKEYVGIEKYNSEVGYEYPALRKDLGVKVSFVSVCENEFGTSGQGRKGACGYDARRISMTLKREKRFSDIVIVIFHGGVEYYPFPTPSQKQRYHALIEQGADAVIGMHSHCPVGYEIYKDKPIVYGTGNFYFPCKYQPLFQSWNYGYVVHLNIRKNKKIDFSYTFYKNSYDGKMFEIIDKAWEKQYMEEICTAIKDDGKLQNLFNGWVKLRGPKLVGYLNPCYTNDEIKRSCAIRNMMCCEAHREILVFYFDMEYMKMYVEELNEKDYREEILSIKSYISIDNYKNAFERKKRGEKGRTEYILWGFGKKLQQKYNNLISNGVTESAIQIVDNDCFKQGLYYGETRIISAQEALKKGLQAKWYICTPNRYFDEIQQSLIAKGVKTQDIYLLE